MEAETNNRGVYTRQDNSHSTQGLGKLVVKEQIRREKGEGREERGRKERREDNTVLDKDCEKKKGKGERDQKKQRYLSEREHAKRTVVN